MITARAPGKVVLWGEYAVLASAPALVMAVNRFATCTVEPADGDWRIDAAGHQADGATVSLERLCATEPPPTDAVWRILWHVLQKLPAGALPEGGRVRLDTSAFHEHGCKLGLGSSAALSVAIYGALCRLLGTAPSYADAMAVHRHLQSGAGSGIDVAAAWHGGLLRYQRAGGVGQVCDWQLPEPLHVAFVWSGTPARTTDHLTRLQRWLGRGEGAELGALAAEARSLFDAPEPLPALRDYVTLLEDLDQAAGLGIFSPDHRRLAQLAIDAGVVYKPCGAGGGDIGAAFTTDANAAARFAQTAASEGFAPLALEKASHGLEVTG